MKGDEAQNSVLLFRNSQSFEDSPRKAILKSIIKLSQHDWCKKPAERNSKHFSLFESTNQCNATVGLPMLGNARIALKLKFSDGMGTSLIDRMLVFLR